MTCHCGRPEDHGEEHRGKCCDCFDSEVLGANFRDDPEYCAACDETSTSGGYTVVIPTPDTPAT